MWMVALALALAVVLIWSGWAKATETSSTLSAIILLKLPRFLQQRWVAQALPIGEIALAVAVLVASSGWPAVLASAAMAALFIVYFVIIARALTFTVRPTCGCFGRIGDQRVRPRTLVRNGVLVAMSLAVLAGALLGGSVPSAVASAGVGAWLALAATVAVAVAAVLVFGGGSDESQTSQAQPFVDPTPTEPALTEANPEAAAGDDLADYLRTPFPPVTLFDHESDPVSLGDLTRDTALLLIGVDCTCGSTALTTRDFADWRERVAPVKTRLFTPMQQGMLRDHFDIADADVLHDRQSLLWRALDLPMGQPAAVLLGADGLLAGGPVVGHPTIVDFIADIEDQLSAGRPEGSPTDEALSQATPTDEAQASDSTHA